MPMILSKSRNRTSHIIPPQTKIPESHPAVDHPHSWTIEEPRGPTSTGACKICGTTRQFKNWLPDMDFITNEEHRTSGQV